MVLSDRQIDSWAASGGVTPYDPACVNPASLDLRWSGRLRRAKANVRRLVVSLNQFHNQKARDYMADTMFEDEIQDDYCIFEPGQFYLIDTLETITIPPQWSGGLMLKSTLARLGFEHLHAGWFDPGFTGTATLEIAPTAPWSVRIEKGDRIVQMIFWEMSESPKHIYTETGRYVGQHGPTPAH